MNLEETKKARYKMNWNSEQASKALKNFRKVKSGSLVVLTRLNADQEGSGNYKVMIVHKPTMISRDFSRDLFFLCPLFTYKEGAVSYRFFQAAKPPGQYAKETLNNTREIFELGRILVEEN